MATLNHGASAYATGRCRCDVCRQANTERVREQRARRKAGTVPAGVKHNEATATNWGCRCDECYEDKRAKERERYARRKEATAS